MFTTYALATDEKLIAMGYRHCPTHWEWVLLLRHHKHEKWVGKVAKSFTGTSQKINIDKSEYISPPVANIVREPNDWVAKGGMPEQVSVYLESQTQRFQWEPSPAQLIKQLQLAFDLYGWDGATGLKAEIFDRI